MGSNPPYASASHIVDIPSRRLLLYPFREPC